MNKRFLFDMDGIFTNDIFIFDTKENKRYGVEKMVDLLNDLVEYNQQLQKENNSLKSTFSLLNYQLKVQDRIIDEYEKGDNE